MNLKSLPENGYHNTLHWKIMIKDDGGNLKTLFHGVNGSRVLPKNVWIKADEKKCRDGSGDTWYRSGFHVLKSKKECEKYLRRFRKTLNYIIVPCLVRGELRRKAHSKSPIFLAKYIKL